MENGRLNMMTMFVTGGVLGAGIALLFAPQSGKRTRRDIAHAGEVGMDKCKSLQRDIKHTMDKVVENVGDKVEDSLAQGRAWTKKTQDRFQRVLHPEVH